MQSAATAVWGDFRAEHWQLDRAKRAGSGGGAGEQSWANQATEQPCYHFLCDLGQVSQLP